MNILKNKILEKIVALQTLFKEKKILLVLLIGVILLLVVLFMLLFRGKGAEPADAGVDSSSETGSSISAESSDSSGSESAPASDSSQSGAASGSEVSSSGDSASGSESTVPEPPKAVTVAGTNINSAGLCVIIPVGAGIKDPNIPENKANQYLPITALSSGKRSEVVLSFSNNVVTKDTLTVLCLQAFDLGDASPELATFEVEADPRTVQSYSYAEISDKIVYNADGKMVVDVTFAKKTDPRVTMEEYIAKLAGKELGHTSNSPLTPQNLLADGTYIYKYDWMLPAFDYVKGHISEMVVPINYATPYTLEELGYTLEIGAASNEPPYLVTVSASTVESSVENGHSGMYTAQVYGGERLIGNYTVLQPTYAPGGDVPNNPSSFALLQAFKRSDLEHQQSGIRFLRRDKPKTSEEDYYKTYTDGPFSEFSLEPWLMNNYIVYSDDDVVIYDFFDFAKAPALEQQIERLSETEGYEHYGIKTDGVAATRKWLLEADGGLGRYIHKSTAK